jgi:ligand-binding sensor domain-containing protein
MKKIYSLLLSLSLSLSIFAGGVDPGFVKIPSLNQQHILVHSDTIWMRVIKENIASAPYTIQKRIISTKELIAEYELNINVNLGIKIDSQSRVWCFGISGIAMIHGENVEYIESLDIGTSIKDLYIDNDTIFVASNSGVVRIHNNIIETIDIGDINANAVSSIIKDKDGNICISTNLTYNTGGLYRFQDGTWNLTGFEDGINDCRINTMTLDNDGNIWLGTYNDGVAKISNQEVFIYNESNGMAGRNIQTLAVDESNRIWAGCNNGSVSIIDNGLVTSHSDVHLMDDNIVTLCHSEGKIYASTARSIMIFENDSIDFLVFECPHWQFNTIAADWNGNIWLASDNNNLIYIFSDDEAWTVEVVQENIERENIIKIAFSDEIGSVGVATEGNGLFVKKDGAWTQVSSSQFPNMQSDFIYDFAYDHANNIWFITDNGAYYYDGASVTAIRTNNGLESNDLNCVAIDNDNNVWFGYYNSSLGLSKFDWNTVEYFPSNTSNRLRQIEVDNDNNLWIKRANGYSVFNGASFVDYPEPEEWDNNAENISNIFIDNRGFVYLSSKLSNYITIIEPDTTRHLKIEDFMSISGIATDLAGNIFVASESDGFAYFKKTLDIDFFSTKEEYCVSDSVYFSIPAEYSYSSYSWDINSDEQIDYTTRNVMHKFDSAGTYNIKLTVSDGTDYNYTVKQITINSNPHIQLQTENGVSYFCENDELIITVIGANENNTYSWNNNVTTNSQTILEAGNYIVSVTNEHGCVTSDSIEVTIKSNPEVYIEGENILYNSICQGEEATLTAITDDQIVSWNTNEISQSISITEENTYTVTVENNDGCRKTASFELKYFQPIVPQIGVVTASMLDECMIIAWEITDTNNIQKYNVYRQTGNTYDLLSSIEYGEDGLYFDYDANYKTRSFSYKLTTTDICGNETSLDLCTPHSTMHLLHLKNDTDYQLLWTRYVGADIDSYSIYEVENNGTQNLIENLSADNNNTYSIQNYDVNKSYRVGVNLKEQVDPAFSSRKSESGPFSQALSNIAELTISDLMDINIRNSNIIVYPTNPKNVINISIKNKDLIGSNIIIVSNNGSIQNSQTTIDTNTSVNINKLNNGSYLLILEKNNEILYSTQFTK